MKIIVVGGAGDVGRSVVNWLGDSHEIIIAGRNSGDVCVDMTNSESIKLMYQKIGLFDALIVTAGSLQFGPVDQLTIEDYQIGLQSKLMGQIHLVLEGLKSIRESGSFTLTSGVLSHDPIRHGSSAAMVNGAIDAFVKSAAIEMPRSIRINSVSPSVLVESWHKFGSYFSGFVPVQSSKVALAYQKSVEGAQTGQNYRVWQ